MKQVIVVNASLKLPAGKLAAQVAHAAIAGFLKASDDARLAWLQAGMPKIVVAGNDTAQLEQLHEAAAAQGLPSYLVTDAGRTVVPAGTVTCLVLGPADEAGIDPLTGTLPLL